MNNTQRINKICEKFGAVAESGTTSLMFILSLSLAKNMIKREKLLKRDNGPQTEAIVPNPTSTSEDLLSNLLV